MIFLDIFLCNYSWWRYARGGVWTRWRSHYRACWERHPIEVLDDYDLVNLVNDKYLQVEIHQ